MLGSLTFYRRILHQTVFNPNRMYEGPLGWMARDLPVPDEKIHKLPTVGHAMAGVLAGATVSFIAAPVEHVCTVSVSIWDVLLCIDLLLI